MAFTAGTRDHGAVRVPACWLIAVLAVAISGGGQRAGAQAPVSDLDAFMSRVLERRDDNWKKLRQYVLDEREVVSLVGPSGAPLWGERRDYTWFIRDGVFVRSPLRANGADVPEAERRQYRRRVCGARAIAREVGRP